MTSPYSSPPLLPIWRRPLSVFQTISSLSIAILLIGSVAGAVYYMRWRDTPFLSGVATRPQMPMRLAPPSIDLGDDVFSLIPKDQIYAGGPPKDGIPAITDPKTVSAISSGLQPADRVIGVVIAGESRAYPLRILDWHEIVNDTLGDRPIAVTYCPLCDSAAVFDRTVGGQVREFGVSGLLYNSNVLMYDRQESEDFESLWSQMLFKAVVGPAAQDGLTLDLLPAQLTTWENWTNKHPKTSTLSFETGHARNYDHSPYTQYFESDELMFPVETTNEPAADADSLPKKELVIVVAHEGQLKGYPASRLRDALKKTGERTVTDSFGGKTVILTPVEADRGLFDATYPDGSVASTAFSFWFEFRAMYPKAEVFEVPDGSIGASAAKERLDFEQTVLQSRKPVLVKFEAEWCGICKAVAPVVKEVERDRAATMSVVSVDVDAQRDIAERYNVTAIPDLILFKDGEPIRRRNGFMDRPTLDEFLDVN